MEDYRDKHLQFEILISDLSAAFVNLPAEEIDEHIEETLRQVVLFLGFDRGTLFQTSEKEEHFFATHCWAQLGYKSRKRYFAGSEVPWFYRRMRKSTDSVRFIKVSDLPPEAHDDAAYLAKYGLKSIIGIPLVARGKTVGFVSLGTSLEECTFPEQMIGRLRVIGTIIAGALERKAAEIALKNAFKEVRELKDRIQAENVSLQEEIQLIQGHKEIIGRSDGIRKVLRQIRQVAQTDSTVLITGETGTGKEMVAWAIHKTSPRKGRAMVCVNCAGLPPSLIESELFGHEKGAFTGAVAKQSGRFEFANSSTIFLDEIGDLPMEVQAKMLRVLQDRRIERLGSPKSIEVDVRIVAATNRDLVKGVKEGRFREDLFYRLNVFPIHVPPLRERRDDIPLLVAAFVQEFSKRLGRNIDSVSRKDMEALQRYSWPGNMRELRNVIERAVILNQGSVLRIHVPEQPSDTVHPPDTLDDLERNHIIKILDKTGWRVSGDRGAARILNINPKTLESRMKKLGIKRPALHS